jgi:hypothetical protein
MDFSIGLKIVTGFRLKPFSAILAPIFKVSNTGTHDIDYSKQRRIRLEIGFDYVIGESLQARWT